MAFERWPTLGFKLISITAEGSRVWMEYIRTLDKEPEMAVSEVLEIEGGLIVASRVFYG